MAECSHSPVVSPDSLSQQMPFYVHIFFYYFSFYVHFKNRHSPIQVCLPLDSSIVYELCALEHQNKSIYLLVYL